MDELRTYIEPNIVTRVRNENFTTYSQYKRYITPMRRCNIFDFSSRGLVYNEKFAETVKYRMCPDVTEENGHLYEIKNLY